MRQLIVWSIIIIVVTSCSNRSKEACRVEPFLCTPPDSWAEKASRLPTARVMEIEGVNWKYHRPPSGSFVRVLGPRGEESIRVLIQYLVRHPLYRTPYFYRPILVEVKFSSQFDICDSPYYAQLETVLTRPDGKRSYQKRAKRDLAKYCADPLGAPWED